MLGCKSLCSQEKKNQTKPKSSALLFKRMIGREKEPNTKNTPKPTVLRNHAE